MVKVSEVQGFLERIRASYGPYQGLSDEAVDAAAFATLPGSGAGSESHPHYTNDESEANIHVQSTQCRMDL